MTRILALDLGTACGWALAADGKVALCEAPYKDGISYGTFDLRHGRFAGGGVRFVRFKEQLSNFTELADEVVFEIVRRHRGTDAAHVYGGLLAILTAWCEENAIPYSGRTVQEIKIFSAGKGNADKAAVVSAVRKWGFDPKNDNEADAIALLRLRLSEMSAPNAPVPLPKRRREVSVGQKLRLACR